MYLAHPRAKTHVKYVNAKESMCMKKDRMKHLNRTVSQFSFKAALFRNKPVCEISKSFSCKSVLLQFLRRASSQLSTQLSNPVSWLFEQSDRIPRRSVNIIQIDSPSKIRSYIYLHSVIIHSSSLAKLPQICLSTIFHQSITSLVPSTRQLLANCSRTARTGNFSDKFKPNLRGDGIAL